MWCVQQSIEMSGWWSRKGGWRQRRWSGVPEEGNPPSWWPSRGSGWQHPGPKALWASSEAFLHFPWKFGQVNWTGWRAEFNFIRGRPSGGFNYHCTSPTRASLWFPCSHANSSDIWYWNLYHRCHLMLCQYTIRSQISLIGSRLLRLPSVECRCILHPRQQLCHFVYHGETVLPGTMFSLFARTNLASKCNDFAKWPCLFFLFFLLFPQAFRRCSNGATR